MQGLPMFASELSYHSTKFKQAALRTGQHILHLDVSHSSTSVVSHGARAFFAELQKASPNIDVQHLRLWDEDVKAKMQYDLSHVQSKLAMLGGKSTTEDKSKFESIEELAASVASATTLVVSVPMWNYGAPWVLKQYFDCVLHPGLTFKETPSGPEGLNGGGKSLVIIMSAGGNARKDHLTPWLTDVAGMIGFDKVFSLTATDVSHAAREQAMATLAFQAEQTARTVADRLAGVPDADADSMQGVPKTQGTDDMEADDEQQEKSVQEWSCAEMLTWLRSQGGLSDDAMESLEALKITGGMWTSVSEDDWHSDELGLEDEDIARLVELQKSHSSSSDSGYGPQTEH